ncbi:MAG: hypothetical protein H6679_00955 [Epsilonproteobacteria bacterium]|nr:hypothetical protein [Campylobacterota bacterium]
MYFKLCLYFFAVTTTCLHVLTAAEQGETIDIDGLDFSYQTLSNVKQTNTWKNPVLLTINQSKLFSLDNPCSSEITFIKQNINFLLVATETKVYVWNINTINQTHQLKNYGSCNPNKPQILSHNPTFVKVFDLEKILKKDTGRMPTFQQLVMHQGEVFFALKTSCLWIIIHIAAFFQNRNCLYLCREGCCSLKSIVFPSDDDNLLRIQKGEPPIEMFTYLDRLPLIPYPL